MPSSWNASLDLCYEAAAGRTVVARRHDGPLQVQKALYPEGDAVCHTILVHPPGGIAGGDSLAIRASCQPPAHALLTTPGATRWYKADGRRAAQSVRLEVAGRLEWLPQETIVFNQALVGSTIDVVVAGAGSTIGWDVVALGRTAAGESFDAGEFVQTIRLEADEELLWSERTRIVGTDPLLASPVGLGGQPVFGCLWAFGPRWSDADVESLRDPLPPTAAITRLAPRLLLARALGPGTAAVREVLQTLWRKARPLVFAGRAAIAPRIWAT
ncbi:MAG TPA: urease accessory protein UreD [Burkholderiaceae bacterium]|nr:urease accessory protein UreD [Burkholderiaceae bacterium]